MKAYETSSLALRDLLSHPSLQRESIDQTMSRLSEALADQSEIEQAISIGGDFSRQSSTLVPIDEGELDAELKELVASEREHSPGLPPTSIKLDDTTLDSSADKEALRLSSALPERILAT